MSGRQASVARVVAARLVSRAGSEAAFFVGVWGKAAYGLNATPSGIAALMFVLAVSAILGSFASGVLVDRIGPRRTLILAEVVFVPATLALILAETLPALIVLVAVWAFFGAPVVTSGASFAPFLVESEESLARVNAWIEGAAAASIAVGPAVGAIIATYASWDWIFVLDAATSLVAVALVWPIRIEARAPIHRQATALGVETAAAGATPTRRAMGDLREGLAIAYRSAALRYYVLAGTVVWMGFGAFGALEPLFFRDVLKTGVQALGWINTVFGIGLLAGAALLPRLPRRVVSARGLAGFVVATGLGVILYVGSRDIRLVAVGALAWSVVIGVLEPLMRTLVHRDAPEGAVGRVVGVAEVHRHAGELIPLAIAPALAAAVGVQATLIGGGLLTAAVALLSLPMGAAIDRERPAGAAELAGLNAAQDEPASPNP